MQSRDTRIRFLSRSGVDRGFERASKRIVSGSIRPRLTRRWHQTGSKLARHFFPQLGIFAGMIDIGLIEGQIAGLVVVIVAIAAILIQKRALRTALLAYGRRNRKEGEECADSADGYKSLHIVSLL